MTRSEGAAIGPYHLVRSLGQGGAGEVWLAAGPPGPTAPGGDIAVKILTGPASDPTARGIAQQAQAAGSLQQPHILPFYGVVEQENTLAVAMAYARGGSLGDMLRPAPGGGSPRLALPLPPGVVARLVTQLARTLADAHAAGLVHGDVKPSNIFVRTSPSGQPLAALGDFGQSLLAPAAAALAARGPNVGAPGGRPQGANRPLGPDSWAAQQLRFAAPEQLAGRSLPTSDQYALAALTYLLLTGVPPFTGDAPTLAAAVTGQRPAPPSAHNPAISPDADSAILRALEKDPAARYSTIVSFASALDDALGAASASGVTRQLARMAGNPGPGASGSVRLTLRSAGGGMGASDSRRGPAAAHAPASLAAAQRSLRRPLAIIAIVALCVAVLATVLAFRAVDNAAGLPNIVHHGKPTLVTGTTPQTNPTVTASARDAERQLAAVTGRQPLFSDPLSSNANHWPTSGKIAFFGTGGYHIHVTDAKSVVALPAPYGGADGTQDVVVQTGMRFAQSTAGNFAGLLFYASGDTSTYYSFAISEDGRFSVWLHDASGWNFVNGGYTTAITTGLNVPNTLAVLARGSTGVAYFFVNGHYVTGVQLSASGPTSGRAGMIVLDNPTEVIYANFAIYDASQH
ncbi:MAG TPA: serine/threonine-protein kinase [Ktedonobacterales bacterium]